MKKRKWRLRKKMRQPDKYMKVKIDELVPYANNARVHSKEQINKIRASIREFGFVNPVLIDADKGIIAGHGRIEAARLEGVTEVPCVMVEHLTEVQKRAYILADNRLAEVGASWDDELLKLELEALKELEFDITITGFEDDMPLMEELEEEIESNVDTEVAVRIVFQNAEHFRKYEDGLRELVDSYEDVKIVVGGEFNEDQQSDIPGL